MESKENEMNTNNRTTMDIRVKLSTTWIFVMFNMVFADILGFMHPDFRKFLETGYAGAIQVTPEFLLLSAILLEIPVVMILLSRTLKHGVNRWANIVAAVITIAFVVGAASTAPHYMFFATAEVIAMAMIIWNAWKWSRVENPS